MERHRFFLVGSGCLCDCTPDRKLVVDVTFPSVQSEHERPKEDSKFDARWFLAERQRAKNRSEVKRLQEFVQ